MTFSSLHDQLEQLWHSAKEAIDRTAELAELEKVRVHLLGKQGELTELLKSLGRYPSGERPAFGKAINDIKLKVQERLTEQESRLQAVALEKELASQKIDITLPGRSDPLGSTHLITQVQEWVVEFFQRLGFIVAQGPEIEEDYYNFEALNIPQNHPARAMADTFYFADHRLLRTHTSPVQIHEMEKYGVPTRLISVGRVYRRDLDQTHTPMFHQLEGLVVDQQCTFVDLKGLLQQFFNAFFEKEVKLRFRPSYFPFTEPSAEVDLYDSVTGRWLEVLGCGLVHPDVLRRLKINPDEYNGFAFGIGLDRLAMLRYAVPDLRLFFENDLRFLRQF